MTIQIHDGRLPPPPHNQDGNPLAGKSCTIFTRDMRRCGNPAVVSEIRDGIVSYMCAECAARLSKRGAL